MAATQRGGGHKLISRARRAGSISRAARAARISDEKIFLAWVWAFDRGLQQRQQHVAASRAAGRRHQHVRCGLAIRYSPGMPTQPIANGGGWQFDFPSNVAGLCPASATQPPNFNVSPCHHVDYVTVPYASPITAKSMTMTFNVVVQSPAYGYRTAPNNTCVSPANVRLLLEHAGDAGLNNPVDRLVVKLLWPTHLQNSASGVVVTAPLTADQWSDVNGQLGSANTAASPTLCQMSGRSG